MVQWTNALAAGRQSPTPPPDAPGPFSLSEPGRVRTILTGSGFRDVALEAVHEPIWFGDSAAEAYRFMAGMGFSQFLLPDLDDAAGARALDALRAVIVDHDGGDGVCFPSAAWLITAHRL